jgi:hypothetical protein
VTFEEAFNSGCRFKLPEGYLDQPSAWKDNENWWWIKSGNNVHIIELDIYIDKKKVFKGGNNSSIDYESVGKVYEKSYDWYLHPQDEHNMKFGKKLEDLIETS